MQRSEYYFLAVNKIADFRFLVKALCLCWLALILLCPAAFAQLKPEFDAQEYLEMLRISRQQADSPIRNDQVPKPQQYHMIYRSAVGPLKNRWDLWVNNHQTAVISIRGTTNEATSWMENFYSAMVPAAGQLHIDDTTTFNYHLADNPKAAVHIGWLLGMADLSKTIVPQIKQLVKEQGITNYIIMGHSQGGAIAYLLRSHLNWLISQKELPANLTFKTYCSAPPKPGNTYYSYEYNYLNRGGWSIAVINAADWVPETPFTIQTVNDFNQLNPFTNIDGGIKKQSLFVRLYIKYIYNRLKKPALRAEKNNQKYMGHKLYKYIKKSLPQFIEPKYAPTNMYVACGLPVILMPDDEYRQKFPESPKNAFSNHMFWPYYYLTQKQYGGQVKQAQQPSAKLF